MKKVTDREIAEKHNLLLGGPTRFNERLLAAIAEARKEAIAECVRRLREADVNGTSGKPDQSNV